MTDIYTHQDKLELARKIEALKVPTDIKKIKQIIYTNNKGLHKAIDGDEVRMCFHKLTLQTYKYIEEFFKNKKIKKYNTTTINNISESSSNINTDYDDSVRYTNKEKDILRRRNNEKKLNQHFGIVNDLQNYEDYQKNMTESDSQNISKSQTKSKSSKKNIQKQDKQHKQHKQDKQDKHDKQDKQDKQEIKPTKPTKPPKTPNKKIEK
jgi:hypothetical protein